MQGEQVHTSERLEQRGTRLAYIPALDGLRAVAVLAVVLYHAGFNVPGGFLGVESFFVLSGYLITALLLGEWRRTGRINLRLFWLRRARRLLPALFLLLAGTFALAAVLGETADLGGDILAALGYIMNWRLVVAERSYFDPMVRPPLLQHLWSLAVEEQFYLLWPLLFTAGMRFLRERGVLIAVLTGAAASALFMAGLYEPGVDPSRIYYGTDTRASGLLLGAALALVWMPGRAPASRRPAAGVSLDVAGLIAIAALVVMFVGLYERHPLLYRGGLVIVALTSTIAIVAVTHPWARVLPWLLGGRLLRWIGLRSYSIYLWHWPVFLLLERSRDAPIPDVALHALRFVLVVLLAALSYRYVEAPIRHLPVEQGWQVFRMRRVQGRLVAKEPQHQPAGRSAFLGARRWQWMGLVASSMLIVTLGSVASMKTVHSTAATLAIVPRSPAFTTPTVEATPTITSTPTPPSGRASTSSKGANTTIEANTATAATTAVHTPEPTPTQLPLSPFDPPLAAELQRILDETVADGYIPGAILAVNIPGQQPWRGASGLADRGQGRPMTPQTMLRIASVTKMWTAVVVLQLVEEGKIDLDAPIATWLPNLVPDGDKITVPHLLQHTTGLYEYLEDKHFVAEAYETPERVYQPAELVAYATRFPPYFHAGEEGAWDYSSTNYVVLGMLVERVTGNTLAHELRQRVIDPLGLKQTFSAPAEAVPGVQARGYAGRTDVTDVAMSFAFGTGNVVSTVDDLERFARALFGGELLKAESLELMYDFVDGKGAYNMLRLAYGLGLMRNWLPIGDAPDGEPREYEDGLVLGHIGGFGGFRAAVWHATESGVTITLGLNQGDVDPNKLATRVLDAVLTHQGR